MTRILVTGASGFVGRAVVTAFAQSDRTIRAAVRRPPEPAFAAGVEVVQHPDLSQSFDWKPYLEGVDQVVHLAGIAHTGGGAPELYDRVNRRATAELAAASAAAGVRHFVFVSSIRAQSGPSADHALTERDAPAPTDAYGRSKLAAEAAVRSSGVPFTILRPALFYGPGVKGNFALLLRAALSRFPLPVKDFVNRRSLISLDNFISALDFVLSSPTTIGETYVVADPGIPPRLSDLIATMRRAQGRRPLVLPLPTHYLETPLRLLGRDGTWERLGGNLRIDAGKLIAAGWQPLHDTRGGLAALVEALSRANRKGAA
ncbi:MAG: NAD-dependent epimerase/dehydratase family protein [Xanthobacteraceae bacterium]